jgi:hypothetical protein
VEVTGEVSTLTVGTTAIARFDGQYLNITGQFPPKDEDTGDILSFVLRSGLEMFHGSRGRRISDMIDARWAHDWYTLAYDHIKACVPIAYPFCIDLRDIKLYLPCGFFLDFLRQTSDCPILESHQEARFTIICRLSDILIVPEDIRNLVAQKMMEMKLDYATA